MHISMNKHFGHAILVHARAIEVRKLSILGIVLFLRIMTILFR
jgi:hypothetical protein